MSGTPYDRGERLRYEIERLREFGYRVEAPKEIPPAGPLGFKVWVPQGSAELELEVVYPDLFPYFRFEVYARSLALTHHQNPFVKNLCLLGRGAQFSPDDTLSEFLHVRLPSLLSTATLTAHEAEELEDDQAEPFTDYYPYSDGSVLVDGSWRLPSGVTHGKLELGAKTSGGVVRRLAVTRIFDNSGNLLASLDPAIAGLFPIALRGRWIVRAEHLALSDARLFYGEVTSGRPVEKANACNGFQQVFDLVVAPEERARRDRGGVGYVMVTGHWPRPSGPKKQVVAQYEFLRCDRVGREDLAARVPELRPLAEKRVLVVGLGSLGAPATIALAQAGVGEVRLLDHDRIDPGTSVRFPLGLASAGDAKTAAIAAFIHGNHPYTKVRPFPRRLGSTDKDANDGAALDEALQDIDLLFDCTGDYGVEYFLSSFAAARGVPYLMASGTQGGWGGLIYRQEPTRPRGCWWCFQRSIEDGSIKRPPASPTAQVQPQGCADPTFVGAGFDMSSIALAAVRAAVEILSPAYPRGPWDGLVVALRNDDGTATCPAFTPWIGVRHRECPLCPTAPPSG